MMILGVVGDSTSYIKKQKKNVLVPVRMRKNATSSPGIRRISSAR